VCTRLHHDLARLELKVEDDHADVYAVDDLRAMLQEGNGIRAVLAATRARARARARDEKEGGRTRRAPAVQSSGVGRRA